MSSRKTQIPAVPVLLPGDPASLKRAFDVVKEILEVAHGRRGEALDRFVTLRELQEAGIGRVSSGGTLVGAGPGGGDGAGVFDPGPPDFGDTDFSVPPAPTGVSARGVGSDGMIITWNQPGYRNHAYAEVFGWPVPNANRPNPTAPISIPGGGTPLTALQAAAPGFVWTRPVTTNNPHPLHAGNSNGAVLLQRGIQRVNAGSPALSNGIDDQLFPRAFRYFVRFVSTAGIPGPLAPVPQGATGVLTINPTDLLDAMVRNVEGTQVYQELRRMISVANLTTEEQAELATRGSLTRFALSRDAALRQQIVQLTGEPGQWQLTNETLSSVSLRNRATLSNLWTVRMNQSVGGVTYAAGFGLGIETNQENGQSLSTFAISANQFVVSGPTTPFFRVVAANVQFPGSVMVLTLAAPIPANIPVPARLAVSAVEIDGTTDPDLLAVRPLIGQEGNVFYSPGSTLITLTRPQGSWGSLLSFGAAQCRKVGFAVVGPQSIPFVIDTTRGVVGVRGSLIVDGLVRSQIGDFDQLVADSAFINHLRAQTVNANVVIGQRIIAGMPPQPLTGQVGNGDITNFSNYLLELNNPLVGSPLRYYRPGGPQGPHVVAELDQAGNFRLGGNLEVGRNATFNTTDASHLLSIGGVGADTPNDSYALWIGPRSTYGTNGAGRREADALMFVRTNGRVGFNADLFLGGDPLTVPSSTGVIEVRPPRAGGLARVFLSAQVSIAPETELGTGVFDVFLGLISTSYVGRGLGTLRSGIGYWANGEDGPIGGPAAQALLAQHVELLNTVVSPPTGLVTAAWIQVDSRASSTDLKNISAQGSVRIAPGTYKVFVSVIRKGAGSASPHGAFSGSFFAMQTQR